MAVSIERNDGKSLIASSAAFGRRAFLGSSIGVSFSVAFSSIAGAEPAGAQGDSSSSDVIRAWYGENPASLVYFDRAYVTTYLAKLAQSIVAAQSVEFDAVQVSFDERLFSVPRSLRLKAGDKTYAVPGQSDDKRNGNKVTRTFELPRSVMTDGLLVEVNPYLTPMEIYPNDAPENVVPPEVQLFLNGIPVTEKLTIWVLTAVGSQPFDFDFKGSWSSISDDTATGMTYRGLTTALLENKGPGKMPEGGKLLLTADSRFVAGLAVGVDALRGSPSGPLDPVQLDTRGSLAYAFEIELPELDAGAALQMNFTWQLNEFDSSAVGVSECIASIVFPAVAQVYGRNGSSSLPSRDASVALALLPKIDISRKDIG